ncbi:hypothetical protein JTE90_028038, partial [Oedothorax gibbosus]
MTSNYFLGLDRTSKDRYLDKIRSINGVDPYSLTKEKLKLSVLFPNIAYMDVVNYLVYGVSAYTAESFKSYKSLEAYNQFACGWVSDVSSTKINGLCLVLGKVRHSQSPSDKPVQPWVIATVDGVIESAHYTCMAGLGESCTHVGALLFYMQNLTLNREELSVTSVPAYWSQPTRKTVEYLEIHNIDFSTPHAKIESCSKSAAKPLQDVPEMSDTEFHAMLSTLHDSGCGSAILNIVPPLEGSIVLKLYLDSLRDPVLYENYKSVFEEQFMSGVIEQVDIIKDDLVDRIYYAPHHPVIREQKESNRTRLRIVFDMSSKERGPLSLKDNLHSGPNLNPNLLTLLLKFRMNRIRIVADIERAFLSIGLKEVDRYCQRFLWIDKIPPTEIMVYRNTTVSFGIKSSPFHLAATIKHH